LCGRRAKAPAARTLCTSRRGGYGVRGERKASGKTYDGIERSTFLIDSEGNVAKVTRKVEPDTHADDVLAALPG